SRAFRLDLREAAKEAPPGAAANRDQLLAHAQRPVVNRNLRPMHEYSLDKTQQELIHKYADKLEAAVIEVVDQAMGKLAPASLSWGNGKTDFAVNRRENKAADVPKLREAGALKGPDDHDVPVLAVKNADGK